MLFNLVNFRPGFLRFLYFSFVEYKWIIRILLVRFLFQATGMLPELCTKYKRITKRVSSEFLHYADGFKGEIRKF